MARKISFDKEYILKNAKNFIEEKGIECLNARDLCKYIGCSTAPLFRNFSGMIEFKKELKKY